MLGENNFTSPRRAINDVLARRCRVRLAAMNELHAIIDMWRRLSSLNENSVLATVVHVSGSAYRRPGARMLIARDGARVGSVSGGCLEGEIARKAWWLTQSGAPVVRTYDTTSGEDAVWEFGLGCNGAVQILLERVNTTATMEMLDFLRAHRESGKPAVVATIIRAREDSGVRVGDRLLLDEALACGGTLVGSRLEDGVRARAAEAMRTTTSCIVHFAEADVFIEWIGPPLSLVVFGAGADPIPLVAMANQLGWRVTVADGRPAYARSGRLPGADRVVAMTGDDLLQQVDVDAGTAVVMMTHNYPLDARLLPLLLARRPWYLGLLGPRSRTERLFAGLGLDVPANVHAPLGLDVGGDTPTAVALSIAAEIQAAANQRAGGMLKLRSGAIHPPVVEVGVPALRRLDEAARPAYCETLVGSTA